MAIRPESCCEVDKGVLNDYFGVRTTYTAENAVLSEYLGRIIHVRSRTIKRTYLIIASVLLLCVSAYALKTGAFRSLNHLSKAENLLIIQVPISYHTNPPSYKMEEPTLAYNVKVLKDMRGGIPAGEKVVVSVLRKLSPGSRYLLAGKPATRGGKPWLLFHWELGVVEIPPDFKLATLEGKDIAT